MAEFKVFYRGDVKVFLLKELRVDARALPAKYEPAVDKALQRAAQEIVDDVSGKGPHAAPIRTGALRASYRWEKIGRLRYEVSNDPEVAPYAIFLELGTRKMAARPHLVPAAMAVAQKLPGMIKEAIQEMFG